jgi:hypothetical protein
MAIIAKDPAASALSLADLESYDSTAPRCSGKTERRFLCIHCGDKKPRDRGHRSLALNTRTGAWFCHRCSEKGLLKDFWTDRPMQTRQQKARAAVARAFALPPKADDTEKHEAATDHGEMWRTSVLLNGTPGVSYLESRGIPSDVAHEAGVRFSFDWYGRPAVLFPMYDRKGEMVAVNGRFVDGRDNPKTQTAGPKSLGLFATPGALSAPLVAICEGPMDALSLWLCGIASVALVGTSGPEWLPSALAFRSVLIATDADLSGDEAAAKLLPALTSRGARTLRLRPCGGKDWSELLEARGADALRTHLAAFSETADEETRFDVAWQLMQNGRADFAHFIVSLVDDAFTREMMRAGLSRARRVAVSNSECVA